MVGLPTPGGVEKAARAVNRNMNARGHVGVSQWRTSVTKASGMSWS